MRITNSMVTANALQNINKAANRLATTNEAVSSQQKIQSASDDPVVATRAVTYRSYVSQISQYQDNVDAATGWQEATDAALSDLSDVIQNVQELTTEAASDTLSDTDREGIKTSIESLRDQAISIMNSTYAGRYIFGGYSTSEAPYESVSTTIGDSVTFKGNYVSLAAVVSADVDDADIISFYTDNTDVVSNSVTSAATTATTKTLSAQAAAAANPTDTNLAAKALAALNVSDTLTAAAVTYGSTTTLTDAAATAKSDYEAAKAAAEADPTNTTLVAAEAAAKNTSDVLSATVEDSNQDINYNIGFSSEVTVNIEGQDVVGEGTGSNLFDTFDKLLLALDGDTSYKKASLDSSGNVTVTTNSLDISELLSDLDEDYDRMLVTQATLGARMEQVSNVSDTLGNAYTSYKTLMSENEDVDLAVAVTEQTTAQYTYEASLSVAAKAMSKTLIDYIG